MLLAACETPGPTTAERVEMLYVAALGRKPTEAELDRTGKHVADAGTSRRAERLGHVIWVLLNAAEVRLNH